MGRAISSFVFLLKSFYLLKRGNASKARETFDASLARMSKKPDFMDAYDARILIQEGRHEEAKHKLAQAIATVGPVLSDDAKYIQLYCQCALALYDGDSEALLIKARAEALHPRRSLRQFLPMLSDDSIARIVSRKSPGDALSADR